MKARYIMVGGFLGAGKTTLIAKLGKYLESRGRKVGLITNDQSSGLVDTSLLRGQGFTVGLDRAFERGDARSSRFCAQRARVRPSSV